MLQSMENASAGSHLEVRLASEIKQDSVNTFLQYLYEGFMMLTEENVKDVEKIGRLLQVESVTKCCVDFYKCMNIKTGAPVPGSSYKYSVNDTLEFRHVRATELQKTVHERTMKRNSDFNRPGSPGMKRQRMQRGSPDVSMYGSDKADDTVSMAHSYMSPDPWDRVPRLGAGSSKGKSRPGVVDIVEESVQLIETEPPGKDPGPGRSHHKQSVAISVASQYNTEPELSIVNVPSDKESNGHTNTTSSHLARGSITVSPLTIFNDSARDSPSQPEIIRHESAEIVFPERIKVTSTPRPPSSSQTKPFAAGSANQSMPSPSGMSKQMSRHPPPMTSGRVESASPTDGDRSSR